MSRTEMDDIARNLSKLDPEGLNVKIINLIFLGYDWIQKLLLLENWDVILEYEWV